MRVRLLAAVVSAACLLSTQALAWHSQGHMMVAEIAWKQLTAGAKCRAVALLESDPEYARGLVDPGGLQPGEALFVNAATWPDRIKALTSGFKSDGDDAAAAWVQPQVANNAGLTDRWAHKYWHFADYPVPDDPGHPPPPINLLERIATFRTALSDASTPKELKAYDLAWLLHLVGDAHQPLHLADQVGTAFSHGTDAGGNAVKVTYTGYSELHGFWDGTPGDASGSGTLKRAIVASKTLPPPPASKVVISDPMAWGRESHALAAQYAYAAPVTLQSTGAFALTPAYAAAAQDLGRRQVALAGARLGKLLNLALAWPDAACDAQVRQLSGAHHPRHRRAPHT